MKIETFSSDKKIIHSGTTILFNNDSDLIFKLSTESDDFNFDLKLVFKDDKENKSTYIKTDVEGTLITITCYNFNNSLGSGTVYPQNLATIGGKKLYFHFIVYKISQESSRHIIYSLNLDIGNEEMAISKIMEKEVFNELNDELKGKVIDIYKHYQKQKNESIGGKLSKLLGSNTNNISLYISFTLCFLLIIVGIIYFWIPKNEREKNILEFWNLIIPIITATLGYIFGRNN